VTSGDTATLSTFRQPFLPVLAHSRGNRVGQAFGRVEGRPDTAHAARSKTVRTFTGRAGEANFPTLHKSDRVCWWCEYSSIHDAAQRPVLGAIFISECNFYGFRNEGGISEPTTPPYLRTRVDARGLQLQRSMTIRPAKTVEKSVLSSTKGPVGQGKLKELSSCRESDRMAVPSRYDCSGGNVR
jgi:hypothetical protein